MLASFMKKSILIKCVIVLNLAVCCFFISLPMRMGENSRSVVLNGGYRYGNGGIYVGSWNAQGHRHGNGHLLLRNGTRYDGSFEDGYFHGLGVLTFPDGAKYEGEFLDGWFHGHGIFWRTDGMKYEGEFRGGKIWGLGLATFNDGTNGFPRYEGYFQDCKFLRKCKCPEVVHRAQKVAFVARNQ